MPIRDLATVWNGREDLREFKEALIATNIFTLCPNSNWLKIENPDGYSFLFNLNVKQWYQCNDEWGPK